MPIYANFQFHLIGCAVQMKLLDSIWNAISRSEATTQKCSYEKMLWKYAANLQENTHAEVRFQ